MKWTCFYMKDSNLCSSWNVCVCVWESVSEWVRESLRVRVCVCVCVCVSQWHVRSDSKYSLGQWLWSAPKHIKWCLARQEFKLIPKPAPDIVRVKEVSIGSANSFLWHNTIRWLGIMLHNVIVNADVVIRSVLFLFTVCRSCLLTNWLVRVLIVTAVMVVTP